jgi:hypothetical protein
VALPVLSVPAPAPEVSRRLELRDKTVPYRARQMMLLVRRWLPGVVVSLLDLRQLAVPRGGSQDRRNDEP